MINKEFSFIILTFNEQIQLRRLLDSIQSLNAPTYVLDSGSTDHTLNICKSYGIQTAYHPFTNHPKQWHAALNTFDVRTPWVICLDADQTLSERLLQKLADFKDTDHRMIDGIYFNRKNYFKGKWIRYGGYYPKYLLKMFRYCQGYSDLSENMDHRFQVSGPTLIWKKDHLIEENLKENEISFWIAKHNTYSDLLAREEASGKKSVNKRYEKPVPWRSPNEYKAWLKQTWQCMPLYVRPALYFIYRMTFQLGILDGKRGFIFHFLQCFWFRLLVDIKIDEIKTQQRNNSRPEKKSHFIIQFILLFFLMYTFHLAFIGITAPGKLYFKFADQHLNYIAGWRTCCIRSACIILKLLGYQVQTKAWGLSVKNHAGFTLVYSCLGYGIMSCFSAFVISFPKSSRSKILFLITGLLGIQLLNTLRLTLIAIYYTPKTHDLNHHLLFNSLIYSIVVLAVYWWINLKPHQKHASHTKKEFQ